MSNKKRLGQTISQYYSYEGASADPSLLNTTTGFKISHGRL